MCRIPRFHAKCVSSCRERSREVRGCRTGLGPHAPRWLFRTPSSQGCPCFPLLPESRCHDEPFHAALPPRRPAFPSSTLGELSSQGPTVTCSHPPVAQGRVSCRGSPFLSCRPNCLFPRIVSSAYNWATTIKKTTYLPRFPRGFWTSLHISAPLPSEPRSKAVSLPTRSPLSLSACPHPTPELFLFRPPAASPLPPPPLSPQSSLP